MGWFTRTESSKKFWKYFLYASVISFVLLCFMSWGFLGYMPSMEELEDPQSAIATEVISSDGVLLGKYYLQNRSNASFQELPKNLVNALIATEDARFYSHSGIDLKALFRAVSGVVVGERKGGGSTITQQTAKNLFPRQNSWKIFILFRKIKEWIIAVKLERNFTKDEIIALYFNTVEFSDNAYGVKSAARTYFNSSVDSMKIEECATLVGMLKAPYQYNPRIHPEASKKRRNVVLDQMYNYQYITKEVRDSLFKLPVKISYHALSHEEGLATYFREYLRLWLKDWCKKHKKANGEAYDLYKDGLKIYTTLDSRLQKMAEEAQKEHLSEWQKYFFAFKKGENPWKEFPKEWENTYTQSTRFKQWKAEGKSRAEIDKLMNTPIQMEIFTWAGPKDTMLSPKDSIIYHRLFLQNGFMAMEPVSGYVKAWVGGINYPFFQYDHVNVNTKRQSGSTFKPFVYCAAIRDKGFSPCTVVPNSPVTFQRGDPRFKLVSNWTPKNSDNRYGGSYTLKSALANSVNVVTAYLMHEMSPEEVVHIAHEMGVTSEIPEQPSICLGTADISLIEMVGAYTTFINQGVYTEPIFVSRIEDRSGNIIQSFVGKRNEVMDEKTAYNMIELMRGVVKHGTGMRLRFKYGLNMDIIGKTGTTQNNSDGWFIGATPDLLAGSWVGCEDRFIHFNSMAYGQGASTALPIWAKFFQKVYSDTTTLSDYSYSHTFLKPENFKEDQNCWEDNSDIKNKIDDYGNEDILNEDSIALPEELLEKQEE